MRAGRGRLECSAEWSPACSRAADARELRGAPLIAGYRRPPTTRPAPSALTDGTT